jgi:hypothetical protein
VPCRVNGEGGPCARAGRQRAHVELPSGPLMPMEARASMAASIRAERQTGMQLEWSQVRSCPPPSPTGNRSSLGRSGSPQMRQPLSTLADAGCWSSHSARHAWKARASACSLVGSLGYQVPLLRFSECPRRVCRKTHNGVAHAVNLSPA